MKNINQLILILSLISTTTFAQDYDSSVGYEYILNELSQTKTDSEDIDDFEDPFSQILIHTGVGWSMSSLNLNKNKNVNPGILQGIEINFGIDLFSKNWLAEGSYRNYGETEFTPIRSLNSERIGLSEFDLKLVFSDHLNKLVRWRAGMGLAARYMNYTNYNSTSATRYTTPSWIFLLGAETKLSRLFSFGATIDFRSAMIDETIDASALTAGIRLDAHF